jgi:hypothetical protein
LPARAGPQPARGRSLRLGSYQRSPGREAWRRPATAAAARQGGLFRVTGQAAVSTDMAWALAGPQEWWSLRTRGCSLPCQTRAPSVSMDVRGRGMTDCTELASVRWWPKPIFRVSRSETCYCTSAS